MHRHHLSKKDKEIVEKNILPRTTRFTTTNWFKEVNENLWFITIRDNRIDRFDVYAVTKKENNKIRKYNFFKFKPKEYEEYWFMIFTQNSKKALKIIKEACKTPWYECPYEILKGGNDDSS